jgi:hypothetical protein
MSHSDKRVAGSVEMVGSRPRQIRFALIPPTVRSATRAQALTLGGLRRLYERNWVEARQGEKGGLDMGSVDRDHLQSGA